MTTLALYSNKGGVGKTAADARAGGCSGCVETGAFGKESCVLTGYFNLPKVLELTLHDGLDPRTGVRLLPSIGSSVGDFDDLDSLFAAFEKHLHFFSFAPLELRDHAGHRLGLELGFRRSPASY